MACSTTKCYTLDGFLVQPKCAEEWGSTDKQEFAPIPIKYNAKQKSYLGADGLPKLHRVVSVVDDGSLDINQDMRFKDCDGNEYAILDGSINRIKLKCKPFRVQFIAVT